MERKKEIENKIIEIRKETRADIKEVMDLVENKEFNVRISEKDEIYKRMRKFFKVLNLKSVTYGYSDNPDLSRVCRDIYYIEKNKESIVLSNIQFKSIDLKNKTFKIEGGYSNGSYYLYQLVLHFNISKEPEVIKEFTNGNKILKFERDEDFKKFEKLVYFTNPETKAVLKAINKEDLNDFKDKKSLKRGNCFSTIHYIRERLNLDRWIHLNSYLIFETMEKMLKELEK